MIDVLFIDYGNQATVSSTGAAPLTPQFSSVPGAAAECQLAFIVPPEDEDWKEDSLKEVQVSESRWSDNLMG